MRWRRSLEKTTNPEVGSLDKLLSPKRQEFYRHIRTRLTEILPNGEARVVLTAAMGSSIKDILLNIPLSNNAVIIVFDDGPFISLHAKTTEHIPEEFRTNYRAQYSQDTEGSNFLRSGDFGYFEQNGYGKKDLLLWELDDLGVDSRSISSAPIPGESAYRLNFRYDGKNATVFFLEISTSHYQTLPKPISEFIEREKIDAVITRGDDGAFKPEPFSEFVLSNLDQGAIELSDRAQTLKSNRLNPIDPGEDVKDDLAAGISFGYPSSTKAFYRMPDSVPLSIRQKT